MVRGLRYNLKQHVNEIKRDVDSLKRCNSYTFNFNPLIYSC